jgi:hypothetical protein
MWTTGCDHEQVCNVCISAMSRIFFGANAQNCQGGALMIEPLGPLAGRADPCRLLFLFSSGSTKKKRKSSHHARTPWDGLGITTVVLYLPPSNTTAQLRG